MHNLWHIIFPLSLLQSIRIDLLHARKYIKVSIKQRILGLHYMWIERYNLIQIIAHDESFLDELIDLRHEIHYLIQTDFFKRFLIKR